jgi:hypothetical protein
MTVTHTTKKKPSRSGSRCGAPLTVGRTGESVVEPPPPGAVVSPPAVELRPPDADTAVVLIAPDVDITLPVVVAPDVVVEVVVSPVVTDDAEVVTAGVLEVSAVVAPVVAPVVLAPVVLAPVVLAPVVLAPVVSVASDVMQIELAAACSREGTVISRTIVNEMHSVVPRLPTLKFGKAGIASDTC